MGPGKRLALPVAVVPYVNAAKSPADAADRPHSAAGSGGLSRPIIVGQGSADPIVSPKEAPAYPGFGARGVDGDDPLGTYTIAGMGHGGGAAPFVEAALTEVENWITYRQTGGAAGSLPRSVIGLQPLPHP